MDKIIHYLKWEEFTKVLEEKNLKVFSLLDLQRIFSSNTDSLKRFLSRHSKKNHLIRLKRGLYCLEKKLPHEFELANFLYKPSFISLESALSYYSIIPESVYSITSVTTKSTREFSVQGKNFIYNKIKKEAFVEYLTQKGDTYSYFIATPEKALADYLYFVSLGFKSKNERTDWTIADLDKVKILLLKKFGLNSIQVKKLLP